MYDSFFRPYVSKHENEIDRNLLELRTRAGDMAILYWQRAASYGQTRIYEILQFVAAQSTPRTRPPQVVYKEWFWIYFASCLCFLSPCLITLFGDLCWEPTHLEQCWTSLSFHERKLSGQSWPSFFFSHLIYFFDALLYVEFFCSAIAEYKSYILQVIYYWSCVLICYTWIVFLMSCNDFTSEIQ